MAVAGNGVVAVVESLTETKTPAWIERVFRFINDVLPGGILRTLVRLAAVQCIPVILPRNAWLVFASHHAPLWKTGRHSFVLHDFIAFAFPFQHRIQTLYFLLLLPRLVRAAERLLIISDATRKLAEAHLPGLLETKSSVIPSYNAGLESAHAANPTGARETARFLFVGAKYRHKNLSVAMEAVRMLHRNMPQAKLVVLGFDEKLWTKHLEHHETPWLETVPYATSERLEAEYARCTALVYPSLAEGLGFPPLEALARGMPVICSGIPALRETCMDAAFYVDPDDPGELSAKLAALVRGELQDEVRGMLVRARQEVLPRFGLERIKELWREELDWYFQRTTPGRSGNASLPVLPSSGARPIEN